MATRPLGASSFLATRLDSRVLASFFDQGYHMAWGGLLFLFQNDLFEKDSPLFFPFWQAPFQLVGVGVACPRPGMGGVLSSYPLYRQPQASYTLISTCKSSWMDGSHIDDEFFNGF